MSAGADSPERDPAGTREPKSKLARRVGPVMLLLFIVGDMLGGGIYTLVGEVGGEVGGAIWTAFAVAFILAGLTACAYAELVSKYPRARVLAEVIPEDITANATMNVKNG